MTSDENYWKDRYKDSWKIASDDLWFRLDKIENAIQYLNKHYTFFVHYLPSTNFWRVIFVSKEFVYEYNNNMFQIVHPTIRGVKETYVSIPSNYKRIHTIDEFIEWLNKISN